MANFLGSNYTADQVNAVPGLATKAKGLLGFYQQQRMAGTYAGGPSPADIINQAMADPVAFEKKALANTVANAIESSYDGNSVANQTANAKSIIDYLQQNNVSADELNSLIQSGKTAGEEFNTFRSRSTDTSIFGSIMSLIPVAIIAIAAPEAAPLIGAEMGLTGAAANAAGMAAIGASSSAILAAGNGASADQIATAALVGGASGAVAGAAAPLAGEISSVVGKDAASIIANAAAGATKSVISGSDPLAGAAGGAVGTGVVEAANAGDVGSTLSKAVGGAAGGATSALVSGKDPLASAAASFLSNLASGAYSSLKSPTTTSGIDPSVPQYAQNVTVTGVPSEGYLMGAPISQPPPDPQQLQEYLDNNLISKAEYDKGMELARSAAGQSDYLTSTPQIIDQKILDTISQQSRSAGGGTPIGNINIGQTQSGFGITQGARKGASELSGSSATSEKTGVGGSGVGTGQGGGGTGEGGSGEDSGYTPSPGISTVSKILGRPSASAGTGTSSSTPSSSTLTDSLSLSSSILGGSLSENPSQATGEPTMLSDGKRKDVWNLESLRGALGI
jgi:hypothetical protein